MYYVYVLLSLKDRKRYIGSTSNLERRLNEHNQGSVVSTRNRRPLKLIYFEEYGAVIDSINREKFFKTHKGYNELKKILTGIGAVGSAHDSGS